MEDEPDVLLSLKMFLENKSFGMECILMQEVLKNLLYLDFLTISVISDIRTPDMNGPELYQTKGNKL